MNATRYVRRMRKQHIHFSLVLQAQDLAFSIGRHALAAIGTHNSQRIRSTHAKAVQRALRRSDRYNRFNNYCYGF